MTIRTIALPTTAPSRATSRARLFDREWVCGWLFIAPALLGFVLFYLVPTLRALSISLTNWNLLSAARFVGLANYRKLLGDARFWDAMGVTALYVLYNIPLQTVAALALALLLDRFGRAVGMRAIVLLPFLISNVIVAMIWYWMLDPVLGFGNAVLAAVGFDRTAFFSSEPLALPSVAVVNIWRHTGFNALLFYSGLQAIPRHRYEALRRRAGGGCEFVENNAAGMPLIAPLDDRHATHLGAPDDRPVVLGVRPENIHEARNGAPRHASVRVEISEPMGAETHLHLDTGATRFVATRFPPETARRAGDRVELTIDVARAHLFDPTTEGSLTCRDARSFGGLNG